MKLIIRSVFTWEHANIRTWEPFEPKVIADTVNVDIGPTTEKGSDAFNIKIATPAGLSGLDSRDGIIAVRSLLIIDSYDYNNL